MMPRSRLVMLIVITAVALAVFAIGALIGGLAH